MHERIAGAMSILAQAGVEAGRVEPGGAAGEIAVIIADVRFLSAISAVAPRIKALGFRYVALDLE